MNAPLHFFVPGLPKTAGSKNAFCLKKGGVYTGRAVVFDNCKGSRDWKAAVSDAAAKAMEGKPLFTGPVGVRFKFTLPRPKGHFRTGKWTKELRHLAPMHHATKPDVLKLARAVEDALTGIVWRDDAQICKEQLHKNYPLPMDRIGVLIEIWSLVELGSEHETPA